MDLRKAERWFRSSRVKGEVLSRLAWAIGSSKHCCSQTISHACRFFQLPLSQKPPQKTAVTYQNEDSISSFFADNKVSRGLKTRRCWLPMWCVRTWHMMKITPWSNIGP